MNSYEMPENIKEYLHIQRLQTQKDKEGAYIIFWCVCLYTAVMETQQNVQFLLFQA